MAQNGNNAQDKASELTQLLACDGNCEKIYGEHRGKVKRVSIEGWGEFNYCENAIKEDISRGLKVTVI